MLRKMIQFLVTEVINAIAKRLEEEQAKTDQAVPCCQKCDVVDVVNAETGAVKFCEGRADV